MTCVKGGEFATFPEAEEAINRMEGDTDLIQIDVTDIRSPWYFEYSFKFMFYDLVCPLTVIDTKYFATLLIKI